MELSDFYEQIVNPLDNPQVMNKLLKAYANTSNGTGNFYDNLVSTVDKKGQVNVVNPNDKDYFFAMMFNKWKNNIVSLNRYEINNLLNQGIYGQDFLKMRDYLKTVPDVRTKREADNVFFGNKNDPILQKALNKYRWTAFGENTGFRHVCSQGLTAHRDKYPDVKHRLYVDTSSLDIYKFVSLFTQLCDAYHLPYYYKFDENANRDDCFVIYSSDENIAKYIEVLRQMQRKYPNFVANFKEPPVLSGVIDGWIGYGSEPLNLPNQKRYSFNSLRSETIENSFDKVTFDWLKKNINDKRKKVTYRGQTLNIREYLSLVITENLSKKWENIAISYHENALNYLGYDRRDISSNQFQMAVYNAIYSRLFDCISQIGSQGAMENIAFKVRNNKYIYASYYDIIEAVRGFSPLINIFDKKYLNSVSNQIKTTSSQKGVDPQKFCFDSYISNKLRKNLHRYPNAQSASNQYQQNQNQRATNQYPQYQNQRAANQYPQNQNQRATNQYPQNQNQKATNQYPQYQNQRSTNQYPNNNSFSNQLTKENISTIISPSYLNQKITLQNGNVISAKQYLEEFVFKMLPTDGFIILNDNSYVNIKSFIEQGILGECQTIYNGDLPRYLGLRTKNNIGFVTLNNGQESQTIPTNDLLSFINPMALNRQVKDLNGQTISLRKYLQKYFLPHVFPSGNVILQNGQVISAVDYINFHLLDINDMDYLLFNTTRNNCGVINVNNERIQAVCQALYKQSQQYYQQNAQGRR